MTVLVLLVNRKLKILETSFVRLESLTCFYHTCSVRVYYLIKEVLRKIGRILLLQKRKM